MSFTRAVLLTEMHCSQLLCLSCVRPMKVRVTTDDIKIYLTILQEISTSMRFSLTRHESVWSCVCICRDKKDIEPYLWGLETLQKLLRISILLRWISSLTCLTQTFSIVQNQNQNQNSIYSDSDSDSDSEQYFRGILHFLHAIIQRGFGD